MKRRMLDAGLWANEKFAELPCMARLLQIGLINLADDQGRMKAHPAYLRSQLFAYDDVSLDDIGKWLEMIMANGTIVIYEAAGKEYLQLVNWWEYQSLQYASPSEHPRPQGWQDRLRYNAKGNMVLTCNWVTVGGDPLTDTCDQDGSPLPVVATLPPRNPGGRPPKNPGENPPGNPGENPPGNPGENVNKDHDQLKNNTTEEEIARDPEPAAPPPTNPPPSYRSQPLPGEYIPGVRRPQHNQAKRNCDHFTGQAAKHGVGAEPFRLMVDAVLDATGKRALADTDTEPGQRTLNQAKETALTLAGMGRRTLEDVQDVLRSWREDDYRGASAPTFGQIVEHASAMAAGTHVTTRRQEGSKKEFSSLADYNEWAARNDPQYKRIREGIIVRGTFTKREQYQPVMAH
jgi:hypothetical protein